LIGQKKKVWKLEGGQGPPGFIGGEGRAWEGVVDRRGGTRSSDGGLLSDDLTCERAEKIAGQWREGQTGIGTYALVTAEKKRRQNEEAKLKSTKRTTEADFKRRGQWGEKASLTVIGKARLW